MRSLNYYSVAQRNFHYYTCAMHALRIHNDLSTEDYNTLQLRYATLLPFLTCAVQHTTQTQ